MPADGQYIANEADFKRYAYAALKSQFLNKAAFEEFYASLDGPLTKDAFLRATSFYLFLVKAGEWHITVEGVAPVVDYLSTSFKVAALFALIESLSEEQNQDFYEWLRCQDREATFPISDMAALSRLYRKYKASYGSIRRCVTFFSRLSPKRQQALCSAIKIGRKPLGSIKKVAEHLYDLRCKFVHEADFVLSLVGYTAISMKGKKVVETNLSVETLCEAFEEGVLAYLERSLL